MPRVSTDAHQVFDSLQKQSQQKESLRKEKDDEWKASPGEEPKRSSLRKAYSWSSNICEDEEEEAEKGAFSLNLANIANEKLHEGQAQFRSLDTRRKRLFYRFEQVMAERGRLVQIPALIMLGAFQVLVFGLLYAVVWRYESDDDPRPRGKVKAVIEGIWSAWTFMSDGGTHAKVYYPEQRFVGATITIFGIIYMAAVLAFIVDMVREKMDAMRVGRGQVHERAHTVILHWTDRTIPLIHELCIANESEGGGVIVLLAKEPTENMLGELNMQLPKFLRRGTKIVVRHGSPAVVSDLIKVSADRAKAVIVLASGQSADESDSNTLRCILSLKSMGYKLEGHIVVEVRDVDNEQLLQLVGGKLVETFVSHDVLGRLMLMSVRQIGLASVYDAILGFEGCEFYVKEWAELVGTPFGDLMQRFPEAVVVGIQTASGTVHLNPPSDMSLCAGDKVVVIAEDDDSYKPEPPCSIEVGALPPAEAHQPEAERILMCGWRRDIRDILKVLDCVVMKGTEVHMMTHCVPVHLRNAQLLEEGLNIDDLQSIRIHHFAGNTSVRRRLESLPLETYTSCLIFADQAYEDDAMQADSHSLATLVLIRDIQSQRAESVTCPITCEVLDSRTHRMITKHSQLSLQSDFVQSNKFVGRILAMIGEQRSIKIILSELLGATGTSVLIIPSSIFVGEGEMVSFWTVAKRVALRNAVLIGYQKIYSKATVVNPEKKDEIMDWETYDLAILGGSAQDIERSANIMTIQEEEEELETDRTGSARTRRNEDVNRDETLNTSLVEDAKAQVDKALVASLQTGQMQQDWQSAPQASSSGGGRTSVEHAQKQMLRLAAKFWPLMTEAEQARFGTALQRLGDLITSGNFPTGKAKGQGAASSRSAAVRGVRGESPEGHPGASNRPQSPESNLPAPFTHVDYEPRTPLQGVRDAPLV